MAIKPTYEELEQRIKDLESHLEQTEETLRVSVERNRLATSAAKVGVWDWNIETGDFYLDPNIKAILGYTDDEIPNDIEIWVKYVHPEDSQPVMEAAQACLDGKTPEYVFEHRMLHKDGSIRWILVRGKAIRDESGNAVRLIGTDADITDRKQIEEQLRHSQKMEAIGTLSGGIAHEFNNILGIIVGNTELAIDDVPEWNPAKDCLKEIRTASLRAKDVVRQIMSIARKTLATREPINIGTLVNESLKLIRATMPASIEIRQEILCHSEMILANQTEINQIIMNLCSNSAQAIEEETGVLEVRLETVALNDPRAAGYEDLIGGNYVKLTAKDTGSGIDPAVMDRITDPYFTTKDVDKGLGMGLAVVSGLVKKHDGAIKIMSELGKGTTAEVLFPVTKEKAQTEVEQYEDLPAGTECILVVDDESSLVKMVSKMLEKQGYRVVGKTNSAEALKLFQTDPDQFDLIITDMAMPGITGDRLAQEFIKIRPDIPLILSTGHSDRIDEDKAKNLGIRAYTRKPLQVGTFTKMVRNILDKIKS